MSNAYFVFCVFTVVYLGMIFGRFPCLGLGRTGIVLLGAIVPLATGIPFDWKQHALFGVPVTLVSLAAGLVCFWIL